MRRLLTSEHLPTVLDSRLALDPQVALRPEPFGALAYHYGNRKLIFLKHPDVVRVVQHLDGAHTLAETLTACDVDETRWPSFERALTALTESEMLHEHRNEHHQDEHQQVAPG